MAEADLPPDVKLERPSAGVVVVSFTGEHDLASRDATRLLLASLVAENRLVLADFSKASFVDTAILVAVRDSGRAARERGSLFRLQLSTAPIVEMVVKTSGALDELDCVTTRQEGLKDAPTSHDVSTEAAAERRPSG
jgi:hypothetical protein